MKNSWKEWHIFFGSEFWITVNVSQHGKVSDYDLNCKKSPNDQVDMQAWRALTKLADVDELSACNGLERLRIETGRSSDLCVGDVIKTFCDESTLPAKKKWSEQYCRALETSYPPRNLNLVGWVCDSICGSWIHWPQSLIWSLAYRSIDQCWKIDMVCHQIMFISSALSSFEQLPWPIIILLYLW